MRSTRAGFPLRVPVTGPLLAGLFACGNAGSPTPLVTTTDSAGIAIVTITTDPASLPEWYLDSVPQVTIRTAGDLEFGRLQRAVWMEDGTIAALDDRPEAIHLFDSTGLWLRSLGRRGDGPGEFRSASSLSAAGDSLYLYSRTQGRLSVFHVADGFARSVSFGDWRLAPGSVWAVGPDRLRTVRTTFDTIPPSGPPPHLFAMHTTVRPADGSGTPLGPEFHYPNRPEIEYGDLGGSLYFWPHPVLSASGSGIVWGPGDTHRLTVFDSTLTPVREIRWMIPPEPLRRSEVDSTREFLREAWRSMPNGYGERVLALVFDDRFIPQVRPALGRVLVDDADRIWIARFPMIIEPEVEPSRWLILDPEGNPLGRIEIPPGQRLITVRGNRALLIAEDSDGVPTLVVTRVIGLSPP